MASKRSPHETNKNPCKVDRPAYGPVKAAKTTIEQVSQPLRSGHQQQGLPTPFSEASLAEHQHGVDHRGRAMLDHWLQGSTSDDPYNAVGSVFMANSEAQYNVNAQNGRSNTSGQGKK